MATGPEPIYKNGKGSFCQGCMNAAIAAGQRMDAAMAIRIFPESTTAGLKTAGLFSCPRFNILGKNKIPRIMATSTKIS